MSLDLRYQQSVQLLQQLIALPSLSKQEDATADLLGQYFAQQNIPAHRVGNNVFALSKNYHPQKPTLLLISHHDTVKPSSAYSLDPFKPLIEDGKLYGLGSNDAGAALVAMIGAFEYLYATPLNVNLIVVAAAEEEISGKGGVEMLLNHVDFLEKIGGAEKLQEFTALVGEPTKMQMAIAERGLMVLDCEAKGVTGHAAREEGVNALYIALQDIQRLQENILDAQSELLGPSKISVTSISTENTQHNVVPASCKFVVDVRLNEHYTHAAALDKIRQAVQSTCTPRSMRLRSSLIPLEHPLVQSGLALGWSYYGSPTTSDKALLPFPAIKIGPGDSARSHTADEYIYLNEIEQGLQAYVQLITNTYA